VCGARPLRFIDVCNPIVAAREGASGLTGIGT
jgi:hypothetical protein